jgi:SagB-type dehydrogenase family enzyme
MRIGRTALRQMILLSVFAGSLSCGPAGGPSPTDIVADAVSFQLPAPGLEGEMSLEQTLVRRRSVRQYTDSALRLEDVSQLLWAAQGVTAEWGGRTAPSAGALYPLEVYLAAGGVDGLPAGVYRYRPPEHDLVRVTNEDVRRDLCEASLGQDTVREGAIDIVIAGVYDRTTPKYGERGERYVHMEAGHAAQNVYLQATALGLGCVTIGAFIDREVSEIMGMQPNESPLYVIPVGETED